MGTEEAIAVEQARYIHRSLPRTVLANMLAVCIVALVFWEAVLPVYIVVWFAATVIITISRLLVWRRFRTLRFTDAVARRWLNHMVVGPAANSGIWGVVSILMCPQGSATQQFTFFSAYVLWATSAMFSYSAHFRTFLCTVIPFSAAIILVIAFGKVVLPPIYAVGVLIFVVYMLLSARRFNQNFIESLRLRFANVDLIQQLTVQKDAAEAANLAKSRFLAAASHDLRQPMHAINLYLGTLAGFDLQREVRALLVKARQCGQTMDEMFRALLDMSRLDASAVQPQLSVFSVSLALDRIRVQFEPEARAKGIELRAVNCSALVHTDPAMVERILRNLVANAVRYTVRGKILVGCRRRGELLRLAVYDTGPGIPDDKRAAVFEEFYQLGNPERDRTRGLGLGLAIVERLARLLRLPLTLESQPGRGSMFAVDLPRSIGDGRVATPASSPNADCHDRADLLVVVIDDEEPILDATRSLLEQWGCAVVTAASGTEAIEQLALSRRIPDVLVCDYRLRGDESGIGVITALRTEFNRDIPALLITGDTSPRRIREIEASDIPVLHKPLEGRELKQALFRLADNRAALN